MSRAVLLILVVAVAVVQVLLWRATDTRSQPAIRFAQVARKTTAEVTRAQGELRDGKSRFVVRFRFTAEGKQVEGEEFLSMRQNVLPQAGEKMDAYYDPQDPSWNTLTDPNLTVNRLATFRLLTLGFGAFTYSFIWVIWKNSSGNKP